MRHYAWIGRATIRAVIFLAMLGTIIGLLLSGCGGDKDTTPPDDDTGTTNLAPVAYAPFVVGSPSYVSAEQWEFDLRHRAHGCDAAGNPTSETGAWDPDGDPLEYRLECDWSVFAVVMTEDGQGVERINSRWVEFPRDDRGEQLALVYIWVGYEGREPLRPWISTQGCKPNPPPTTFRYSVRDSSGDMASHQIRLGS